MENPLAKYNVVVFIFMIYPDSTANYPVALKNTFSSEKNSFLRLPLV
jgi:hypothetical protein